MGLRTLCATTLGLGSPPGFFLFTLFSCLCFGFPPGFLRFTFLPRLCLGFPPGFFLFNGVLLARLNTDVSLADFQTATRNLVSDVENAYWELYFAYRDLHAKKVARDSALLTWKKSPCAVSDGRPRRRSGTGSPSAGAILLVSVGGSERPQRTPQRLAVQRPLSFLEFQG